MKKLNVLLVALALVSFTAFYSCQNVKDKAEEAVEEVQEEVTEEEVVEEEVVEEETMKMDTTVQAKEAEEEVEAEAEEE
jgi:predicted Holliday junction resolvase-like endonuclease